MKPLVVLRSGAMLMSESWTDEIKWSSPSIEDKRNPGRLLHLFWSANHHWTSMSLSWMDNLMQTPGGWESIFEDEE
jgi:hypothetical protein